MDGDATAMGGLLDGQTNGSCHETNAAPRPWWNHIVFEGDSRWTESQKDTVNASSTSTSLRKSAYRNIPTYVHGSQK